MTFLTLAAMECEISPLKEAGLECVQTGIGKVNAARSATEAILKYRPDAIVGTGCAGALCPRLKEFDIVLGAEVAYHDVWCGEDVAPGTIQGQPGKFPADPFLLNMARKAVPRAREGLIVSGDQFYVSREEDLRILRLYPDALAADMESAAIAQVCRHYGVPFLAVRFISDSHSSDEVQKSEYDSFKEKFCAEDILFLKKMAALMRTA